MMFRLIFPVILLVLASSPAFANITGSPGEAAEAWAELRKKSDKPVRAVVYTHFHPDHWGGVKAIISQAQVDRGDVKIIAHRTMLDNVIHQGGMVGPILAMRTAYSFGLFLAPQDHAGMNHGIGPEITPGTFCCPEKRYRGRPCPISTPCAAQNSATPINGIRVWISCEPSRPNIWCRLMDSLFMTRKR
jgi:hypothetical protein